MKGINLIVISSKNCSPCKALKLRLAADNIPFIELDSIEIDYDKFNIMSVPTTFLMRDEEIIDRMDGFNVPEYKRLIEVLKITK